MLRDQEEAYGAWWNFGSRGGIRYLGVDVINYPEAVIVWTDWSYQPPENLP
jgi:hypothetical protein